MESTYYFGGHLVSFIQHNYFEIHSCYNVNQQFIFFNCSVVIRYVSIHCLFIQLLLEWVGSNWGYYKQSCSEKAMEWARYEKQVGIRFRSVEFKTFIKYTIGHVNQLTRCTCQKDKGNITNKYLRIIGSKWQLKL